MARFHVLKFERVEFQMNCRSGKSVRTTYGHPQNVSLLRRAEKYDLPERRRSYIAIPIRWKMASFHVLKFERGEFQMNWNGWVLDSRLDTDKC